MADQWHRLYFDEWVAGEGLELIRGTRVEDVYSVPLKHWARTGGQAVQIQLDGTGELNAAYVQEIGPAKHLEPIRHLYEEMIYVLAGRGSTTVWYEGMGKNTFEWKEGSLFAIPLNAWHQHFNGSGAEPARYIAVTTAPIMMNLIREDDFIFNNEAVFPKRYGGQTDYFSADVRYEHFDLWDLPVNIAFSNLYPDINAIPLQPSGRGNGVFGASYELDSGVLGTHILQIPGGTFTKLHRHGPGAHVIWLKGEGYTILQPDGGERVMERWGHGTMIVPPTLWWHQHCVVSSEPAVHLALKLSSRKQLVTRDHTKTMISTKRGGNQMDYEDTPPEVLAELKRIFVEECAKRGTRPHLEAIHGG